MSLEKQKSPETPKIEKQKSPVSPETKTSREAQEVFTETKEKLKTISSREFLKIPENERLKYITKSQIDSTKVSSWETKDLEFTFTFDSKFNKELYLKTTAWQVLPKEVREVKLWSETYNRIWLKWEFFNAQNRRLTIHENTKLEVSKLGDTVELEKQNEIIFANFKNENKDNKEFAENNYDDLIKSAIDKAIDPKFAIKLFGESISYLKQSNWYRQIKIEELLTNYYRVRNNYSAWNWKVEEESTSKNNFTLALLKETYEDNWKEKALEFGITKDEVDKFSIKKFSKITFDLENIWLWDKWLLDFISLAEWTNLNYNAIFWNWEQNKIDFTNMTLKEILAYQAEYKKSMWSAAIWKYQFMDYTLKWMIERYWIDENDKFSPEMQDKLAYIKLQERWLNDFKNWYIKKENFQFNLSKEWASIAQNETWLSYYHWDKMNNHASNTWKKIQDALEKLYA